MIEHQNRLEGRGLGHSAAALVLAASVGALIAVPLWTDEVIAARLALFGVALFAGALAFGSNRIIGVASLPVLGSAAIASAVADDPTWVRTIIVGCLWYVTVELAWDAIERREDGRRSRSLEHRRIHEVATVVTIALVVAIVGVSASSIARPRTLFVQTPFVLALMIVIGAATARLSRSSRAAR